MYIKTAGGKEVEMNVQDRTFHLFFSPVCVVYPMLTYRDKRALPSPHHKTFFSTRTTLLTDFSLGEGSIIFSLWLSPCLPSQCSDNLMAS